MTDLDYINSLTFKFQANATNFRTRWTPNQTPDWNVTGALWQRVYGQHYYDALFTVEGTEGAARIADAALAKHEKAVTLGRV